MNYEKKPTPKIAPRICKTCRGKMRDFETVLALDGVCMKCKLKTTVKKTEGQLL